MLMLTPFSKITQINSQDLLVEGDLHLLSSDTIEINFSWVDKKQLIQFNTDSSNNRVTGLWNHTCFEVFLQPVGFKKYFEINLNTVKAWNIFQFDSYRNPQPPQELAAVDLLKYETTDTSLRVQFRLSGQEFKKVKTSICSVVVLKDTGTTYWSTKHADVKPNFHHFDSFFIERNAP